MPYNPAVHPPIWSRGLDSVQTTGEKAACLHDATSEFDHEGNLDGQSDKQGHTRTDRAAIYDLLIRKNLRWTGHLMSRFSTLNCLLVTEREGAPRLRFKDTIKRNLKLRDINTDSWTSLSQQRDKWRAIVK